MNSARHALAVPRTPALLAAALALTATAYSQAPQGGFVWDDRPLIEQSTLVQVGGSFSDFFVRPFWDRSAEMEATPVYYRPLTTLTYRVDRWISGGVAGWFHLVNVLLHLACVALVFHLGVREGGSPRAAALTAALFGMAPRLTESVAWISGRTDVLAALFALGALALHRPGPAGARGRVAAAVAIFLGLLAKEVAIAAAAAIVGLTLARARREERSLRPAAGELLPAAVAVLGYGVLRVAVMAGVRQPPSESGVRTRIVAAVEALGTYPLMFLDPLRPRLQIGQLERPDLAIVGLGVAVGVAAVALAIRFWRRGPDPQIAAALALSAAALALVLHVVPIRLNVVAADRFLYVPLAGVAVAAARAATGWTPAVGRWAAVLALVAMPAFATGTWQRVADWKDEETLWREAVRTTPASNFLPAHELGNVLFRARRYAEALELYEQASSHMTLPRQRIIEKGNIASTLSELGQFDRARGLTQELIAGEPDVALHRYNLAIIEARRLDFAAAERELHAALRIFPGYPQAKRALARLADLRAEAAALPPETGADPVALRARRAAFYVQLGRDADAARLYAAVSAAPDADADQLLHAGAFLLRRGSPDEGRRALLRARARGADEATVRALLSAPPAN